MLVLLADGWTNGWSTMNLFCVYRSSWRDPLGYIRLFGHVLGHANWEHFLNNMLLLLVVGPPMEEKYGSIPLLKGILFTALVTGVLQCILFPHTGLLGASGIVFMLIMLSSLAGFSGGIPVTMLLVAALTWIIPAGEYDIVQNPESGIEEIDPSSFHFVERDDPVTFFGFFTAINAGIVKAMGIGSLILVMTGALAVLDSTDALTAGVHRVIAHSKGKEFLIVASFFLLFLICGVVGMAENMMPFIPIVITLVMGLGYDRMLGFAVVVAGLEIGWTAGIVNIYTTGFSQQMIGLPIFSGLGYRTIATVVFFLIGVTYFWFYCKKIKADPSKSCCAEEYMNQRVGQNQVEMEEIPLTLKMKLGLLIFAVALIVQTYGCVKLEWSFNQMSAVFIISTIVTVLVCGINPSKACRIFTTGAADLLSVVFMMGFAQAITALMRQGKILDTIVYYLSGLLQNKGLLLTLLAIFFVVMVMNLSLIHI